MEDNKSLNVIQKNIEQRQLYNKESANQYGTESRTPPGAQPKYFMKLEKNKEKKRKLLSEEQKKELEYKLNSAGVAAKTPLSTIAAGNVTFDSCFESGNLLKAYWNGESEYYLVLSCDVGTIHYVAWYFFSVFIEKKNPTLSLQSGTTLTFHLINLEKADTHYKTNAMRPCVYSTFGRQEWERVGENVNYSKNIDSDLDFAAMGLSECARSLHTLTFSYKFDSVNNFVYFAHGFPYLYSEQVHKLKQYKEEHPAIYRHVRLCYSEVGNPCYLCIISNSVGSTVKSMPTISSFKKIAEEKRNFLPVPGKKKKVKYRT